MLLSFSACLLSTKARVLLSFSACLLNYRLHVCFCCLVLINNCILVYKLYDSSRQVHYVSKTVKLKAVFSPDDVPERTR